MNPNKCTIGWYRTRFADEEIPSHPDWVFPRLSASRYGDFAKYQGSPALRFQGTYNIGTFILYGPEVISSPSDIDLLYVNCKESISNMSSARLYNITYNQQDFETLKFQQTKVIHTRKMMINNSPEASHSEIKFQVETFDTASLKLKQKHSVFFRTNKHSYSDYVKSQQALNLIKSLGIDFTKVLETSDIEEGRNNSTEEEILRTRIRRESRVQKN